MVAQIDNERNKRCDAEGWRAAQGHGNPPGPRHGEADKRNHEVVIGEMVGKREHGRDAPAGTSRGRKESRHSGGRFAGHRRPPSAPATTAKMIHPRLAE